MNTISLLDKEFKLFITAGKIQAEVNVLADRMNNELKNEDVVFMGIMNGAFMFASDLSRRIIFNIRLTFVKLSSYEGTTSQGTIRKVIGINEDLKNKTIVILEDIIETGNTIESIVGDIRRLDPARILIATLLLKPEQYKKDIDINYIGFRIPKNFIVGYGLDYKGFGRNLDSLYMLED